MSTIFFRGITGLTHKMFQSSSRLFQSSKNFFQKTLSSSPHSTFSPKIRKNVEDVPQEKNSSPVANIRPAVNVQELIRNTSLEIGSSSLGNSQYSTDVKPIIRDVKIAVIAGAGAASSREVILELTERGYIVIALTGNKAQKSFHKKLIYVQVERDQLYRADYIENQVRKAFNELDIITCTHLVAINLIGGATDKNSYNRVNFEVPCTFFDAMGKLGKNVAGKTSFIYFSTIAATINGKECEYAMIKKDAEQAVISLNRGLGNVIIPRPGVILMTLSEDQRVDMGHNYSPDQFASLFFIPVIGSGDQIQQPIYIRDLIKAVLKGVESDRKVTKVFNAVGPDVITQKQLIGYFNDHAYFYLHLPTDLARVVAEHFPNGRLAMYAVKMLDILDNNSTLNQPLCMKDTEELLGEKPKSIQDVYPTTAQLVTRKAPFYEHVKQMVKESISNPRKMFSFLPQFIRTLPSVRVSWREREQPSKN